MKTATKATKTALSLVNVCCRILFFYFFWLASFDDSGTFSNRQYAFINDMWAWEQKAYSGVSLYTSTECPTDWVLLTKFEWPGTKEHINTQGDLVPAQSARTFIQWTTNEYQQAFILCGFQIEHNFIESASSSQSCEERSMKDCGIENQPFCVNADQECPINGITLVTTDGKISIETTNIETKQQEMPISLIRVDSYTPCASNNQTNNKPEIEYDENLEETPQSCTDLDQSYIEVNSILDQLYFTANDADSLVYDDEGTKTLFYKQYPFWNSSCNGELFTLAQEQNSLLTKYKRIEFINFILVIIYLLVCNYAIPMIPYIFRCVQSLNYKNLIYIDYFFRIVLSGVMTYLSFLSLNYGEAVLGNLDELWGLECIKDEENTYGRFADQIELQKALDIVAVTFSFVLWAIEGALLWLLGCQQTFKRCKRAFRRSKLRKEMHNIEILEQSDIIQLN